MNKNFLLVAVVFTTIVFISASASGEGEKMQDIKVLAISEKTQDIQSRGAVKPDLDFGKIPLYFVSNKGQVNEKAKFYAKASRYTLWLTKEGLVFDSMKEQGAGSREQGAGHLSREGNPKYLRDVSRFVFIGANKNPEIVPMEEAKLRVNYFIGNNKSKWHCNVPTSQAILYKNLYKNIDLKVYGIEKQIEYDWIVKPGGNPGDIRFEYKNVKGTRIDEEGNLLIDTDFGELMHKKPVSYQEISMGHGAWDMEKQKQIKVEVHFKQIKENTYEFEVGAYDRSQELIIDPVVLAYSTYLGGGGSERGWEIAADDSGNAYVTGTIFSSGFPTLNQYQGDQGGWDAFVTKIDTTKSGNSSLIYSSYLGGGYEDDGFGIAIDGSGNAYVTGYTDSTDFPILNQYQTHQGGRDAFVAKIDTTKTGASSLIYSTYLGGGSSDYAYRIATDAGGNAYVAGCTHSTDFPTLNQYQTHQGGGDAFVAKIDTTKSGIPSLIYSSYLGGGGSDAGHGLATDGSGNAYVTGYTYSTDFPTLNQYQTHQGGGDAFVAKIDTTKSGIPCLIYSSYLGGGSSDSGYRIAADVSGNAYVGGFTHSTDFPIMNQYQTHQGSRDAFVTRIDTTKTGESSLIYSTYLGGNDYENISSMELDDSGNVYVCGCTFSTDFPTVNQYQTDLGHRDGFVAKINTNNSGISSLIYSTYLGGESEDFAYGLAVDGFGNAYVTGATDSTDFPTLNQYQTDQGGYDVFVSKILFSLIDITSPNGGERWMSGSTRNITWDTPIVTGYLKIFLWDAGSQVGTIADYINPASGSYSWTVGQYQDGTAAPGREYKIKIKEKGVHIPYFSDAPFTICSLAVTAPNGGEVWQSGSTQDITWNCQEITGNLKIYLWKDGALVGTIAKNINPASGSYPWTVGQYQGGTASLGYGYTIKIKEMGERISDFSDTPFTISDSALITITSPNGGESWKSRSTQNITWATHGVTNNLKIFLFKNGAVVDTIAKNIAPAPSGSYPWIVGQCLDGNVSVGTGYTIKVKEMGVLLSDFSDAPFTITGITVTAPNGGENWQIGSTRNITWNTQGVSGNLKIFLWKDGTLVGTIAKNINPASGSYAWTVGQYVGGTAAAGTGYTIKVKEMGVTVADFSDATFTLTN